MRVHSVVACTLSLSVAAGVFVRAADPPAVDLIVNPGRALQVTLEKSVRLRHVGQPVTAILSEPLYSYDRIVVPAGAKVFGHIEQLTPLSKKARAMRYARGDFASPVAVTLRFDSIAREDGS